MITYKEFCEILNRHIFEEEKKELLQKISEYPERFIGLFRPSKPETKILQNILQSHEIRFGDALEELIEIILKDLGYSILSKRIEKDNGEVLVLDQFFTDGKDYFFIEQKIRDDHDSSKKRGQINNFEAKLEELFKRYNGKVIGIMYFIDPDLTKNKNFYSYELKRLEDYYKVHLYLFYGKELFDFLKQGYYWDKIVEWLIQWKKSLPEIPDINFDANPEKTFEEIKNLEIKHWRKILENEKLWEEGIIKVIFKSGDTLRLILNYFQNNKLAPYQKLYSLLKDKLDKYY